MTMHLITTNHNLNEHYKKPGSKSLSTLFLYYWNPRSLFLSLLLCLTLLTSVNAQTDPTRLRIRAHDFPQEPAWVGQQVIFYVTVSMTDRPSGTPLFKHNSVPGGILLKIPDSPVYGSEEIDGIDFTTWLYSFAFYPHRAGEHGIPPITVQVRLPDEDGTWEIFIAQTEAFTLSAKWPAGTQGLSSLVSTTQLTIEEKWDPMKTNLHVGDAATRTIRLKAPNVMGMGFPPLPFDARDGLSFYPNPSQVNDEINRGDITGERVESMVYVFEKQGDITLPALVITWFDLGSEEVKQITLPERHFKIIANPAFSEMAQANGEGSSTPQPKLFWPVIIGFIVIISACLLALLGYRKFFIQWIRVWKFKITTSEPFLFYQLVSVVRSNDVKAIINRSTLWLQKMCGSSKFLTLTEFAARYGDENLKIAIDNMMVELYGSGSTLIKGSQKKQPSFVRELKKARKRYRSDEKQKIRDLLPFNPG
jgi:hypothetical protein